MSVFILLLLIPTTIGAWRVVRGPNIADRLLGLQLASTSCVAVLLVFAQWQQQAALRDVALVLALLAAAIFVALVQQLRSTTNG